MDEPAGEHPAQGPPAARQALPGRPRGGPHRHRRGGQARGLDAAAVRRVVRARASCSSTTCPSASPRTASAGPVRERQLAFGYTQEDLRVLLAPTAAKGEEPIGSMGNDSALPVLSRPPAAAVLLLQAAVRAGHQPADRPDPRGDRDERRAPASARSATCSTRRPSTPTSSSMETPILRNAELEKLRQVDSSGLPRRARSTSRGRWRRARRASTPPSTRVCAEADAALVDGINVLVLSDRGLGPERAPIPSLLAVGAVHHHLVREGTRLQAGLVLESGEPREVHHFATLIGYGASAINPYLMFESLGELVAEGRVPGVEDADTAERNVVKGIAKGLLKTISKMGISTIQSYNGAQIFEAVGLAPELVDRAFTGTASRIGGIGLDVLGTETLEQARAGVPAGSPRTCCRSAASTRGAARASTTCGTRRRSRCSSTRCATAAGQTYEEYAKLVNEDAAARATLRGLLKFKRAAGGRVAGRWTRSSPPSEIVKRFVTGAMSLGSLSREAHETLAIAMNRLGGKSNTGEGGEDVVPLHARPQRGLAPLGDQAGRLGPLRRQHQLPRQRGRAADQDGPGRQARRGRPAARPQGRPLHRLDPLHDAGRGPDLAAAAPRHLLDRGPQAADLRPALRQPAGADLGQARVRGRRRARSRRAWRRPTPTTC